MLRSTLLATTIIAGVALTAPAFAQTAAPSAPPAPAGSSAAAATPGTSSDTTGDKAAPPQDIVVTGSRLKRSAFTAPDPITVITSEQAALAGYSDTAQLLQQSSIAAGSFQTNDQLTGYVTTGGPGAKTLNLRRLGEQRTIILLDGKRLGPAGVGGTVGPVDLNVIPQSLVQRVEVLKDGASSIYGSDAVAGVVNIITRKNHDGGELSAYTSQSELGGGNVYQLSGDFGKTFDRGYIELTGEAYQQERLARGQRDYTNCSEDYLFKPGPGPRVDYTDAVTPNYGHFYKCYNLVNNVINTAVAATGSSLGYLQYLQPGVPYPTAAQGNNIALYGTPANPLTQFARQGRAGYPDTYPYANYYTPLTDRQSVISPETRYNVAANAGYDFNSNTHLYGQFLFSDRLSYQTGARQLFPTLGSAWVAGNPNNVFAGSGVKPIYPVIALPSDYRQDVKYYRGVIGLKGDFRGLGWFDRFSYDVYGIYSKSSASYEQDAIYNDRILATTTSAQGCTTTGIANLSNYSCSNLPAGGIPWLSPRVLSGQFTQQERDFLFFKAHGTTDYDQYITEADITGDLFTLPAGAVSGAFGVSYRHDKIDDKPDLQGQLGNFWGSTASGHTAGSDSVKEVFAEVNVPVVKNLPFIQSLNFDISGRYSDYKSYGSTSTYKVAGNWTVIPDLRFRGSIGTSFRAPALYELFLAHQTGFLGQNTVDPCVNYGSSGVTAKVAASCAALGLAPDYNGSSPNGGGGSATISTGGGIGNLQAETSQAKSIGVVITPKRWGIDRWSNLSVALDYFTFDVHNEVTTFGSYNIIYQCLNGNTAFCGLFTRDTNPASPSYQNILTVNNNYVNVASQGVRGLDLTVHADHNFGGYGKLSFDANATWTLTDKTKLLGGSGPQSFNGTTFTTGDGPDFAGNMSLQWDWHDWTVFWYTTMIGKASDTDYNNGDTFPNSRYANIPAGISSNNCAAANNYCVYYKQYTEFTAYHDLSLRKRFASFNGEVTLGVRNLFNEAPPAQSTGQFRIGNSALNEYDLIGRSYFVRLTKKW